jgi:hypothetical protein
MCKLHKDVAIAVAKDPVTSAIDPLIYSVTLCSLAKFWVDKYMPDMGHIDGYSDYEMAVPPAQQSFLASGLEADVEKAREGQSERISFLRDVAIKIIKDNDLTLQSLHLPKRPDKSPRFLDQVMLSIYEGSPTEELSLKTKADNRKHEPLREVIEKIYQIPNYGCVLESALKSSISNLFINAPQNVNPTLLKLYNKFPMGLRTSFGSCSLHSGGGVVAHAVICGGLNTAIGGFSGVFMNVAMYAVAPVVAVGTTYAVEKYRINDFNPYKYIVPVVLSLGAAFAVSKYLPHEHSSDPKMAMFYALNAEQRHEELQRQYQRYLNLSSELRQAVEGESNRQDMTVAMFMASLEVCGADLVPRITAYEREKALNERRIELK